MTILKRTASLAFASAVGALLGGCALVSPQQDQWQPAPVGASWVSAQRSTGSFGTRDVQVKATRGASTWKGTPVASVSIASGGTVVQRLEDGNWIALLDPKGQPTVTFDPPVGPQYPLRVGRSWSAKHRMTALSTGNVTDFEVSCNVEAYEKVTVRAGTFDAFKIGCTNSLGSQDTYWLSPNVQPFIKRAEVRGASHPSGPGTQDSELIQRP